MIHKVIGWFLGYLTIFLKGEDTERFVNLCRHHKIDLWDIYWREEGKVLYVSLSLQDFWRIRPIAKKTRLFPRVVKRHGAPFLWQRMMQRKSFFAGLCLFFGLVLFLSTRIWNIDISGEGYHTKESLLNFLESKEVYGGVAISQVSCSKLEEEIRKKYEDIGWVSVEQRGSRLLVRMEEVRLVNAKKQEKPAHLVAAQSGRVISVVTRQGTAKVHAGDEVKKGDILISGVVRIIGDGEELLGKSYVRAQGTVIIESQKKYSDQLSIPYQKKYYTGSEKKVYQWNIGGKQFFWHNPLNRLETYEKYDIIREGGQVCSELSLRFPAQCFTETFREVKYRSAKYSKQEAKEILEYRWKEYLKKKQEAGYEIQSLQTEFKKNGNTYQWDDQIVWWKEQKKYRMIPADKIKTENKKKDEQEHGNNGDIH